MAVRVRFPLRVLIFTHMNKQELIAKTEFCKRRFQKAQRIYKRCQEDYYHMKGMLTFLEVKLLVGDKKLYVIRNTSKGRHFMEVMLQSSCSGCNSDLKVTVENVKTGNIFSAYLKDLADEKGNFLFR